MDLKMKVKVVLALVVVFALVANDVMASDWKLMGGLQIKKEESFVFYDNASIEHLPNGNIKVWTKSIKTSEIDKITSRKDILKKSAEKLINNYYPPFAIAKDSTFEEYVEIINLEEAANYPGTKANMVVLSEIDCAKKKVRLLSLTIYQKDGIVEKSKEDNNKWSYIAPDSNFETLLKILCHSKP